MMELYIETLTGAAFELRVSPFETIMSVKAKIQRLEGIPISQQHLVWQNVDLDDDYCLQDYEIYNGATLKLVLAMRGGPINTRRVPLEESSYVEYVESTPDELMDKVPSSNRQVTLLVFREGDQLNFFRVVDRGDGTLTPLSESLSAASMYNIYDEEEEPETFTKEKSEENAKIREKINSLKSKMDNISISKKTRKLTSSVLSPEKPGSGGVHTVSGVKPVSAFNKNLCLPPVLQKSVSVQDNDFGKPQPAQLPLSPSAPLTEPFIPKPPSEARTARHDISQALHHPSSILTTSDLVNSVPNVIQKSYSARSLRSVDKDNRKSPQNNTESKIRSIPEDEVVAAENTVVPSTFAKKKEHLSINKFRDSFKTSAAVQAEGFTSNPHRASSRLLEGRVSSRQHNDIKLGAIKDSLYSQRITLESLSSNEAKFMSGLLHQANLERIGSSSISSFGAMKARKLPVSSSNTLNRNETCDCTDKSSLTSLPVNNNVDIDESFTGKLPPVKSKKSGNSKRCLFCGKKTGLATSYICRCGNNFCASHRYAEMHNCTFDYKSEGRQLLEQNNPVVTAPKLPKI